MDVLIINCFRNMFLGLLYMLAALILLMLSPFLIACHFVRRLFI